MLDLEFYNQHLAEYANRKQSIEPLLKGGDKVYLLQRHIKTKRPSNKLDFKKLGPFKIIEKTSIVNYQLDLPKHSKLHSMFHVSLLELAQENAPININIKLQLEHDVDVYNVEKVLDSQISRDRSI